MRYQELEHVGLSPNESKCYIALLDTGSASANEISRKSGVHRVAVYDALRGLREKGFVSQILKANKLLFEASSPRKINDILEEKKRTLEETRKLIPELLLKYSSAKEKQEVHNYKGVAGLKTVFQNMLTSTTDILDFGAEFKIKEVLKYYYKQWDDKRVKKRISMRIVANAKIKSTEVSTLQLTKIRYVPEEFTSNVSTYIYENKVVIVMWVEEPIAVLIEHSMIAQSYKNYFEYLWKSTGEKKVISRTILEKNWTNKEDDRWNTL